MLRTTAGVKTEYKEANIIPMNLENFSNPEKQKDRSKLSARPNRLLNATDWQFKVDIGKFTEQITKALLQPDMIIFSNTTKQIIKSQSPVPWEDNIVESNTRKSWKYYDPELEYRNNGLRARCEPVGVGGNCFVGR